MLLYPGCNISLEEPWMPRFLERWPGGKRLKVTETGPERALRDTASDCNGLWFKVLELEVSLGFLAVRASYCSVIWLKIKEKYMINEINKDHPPEWVSTGKASLTLQPACVYMCVLYVWEELFHLCNALSIERGGNLQISFALSRWRQTWQGR